MTHETGELARCHILISKFDLEIVHRATVKHQSLDLLFCFPTTIMAESLLEQYVPVLIMTEAQPEGKKTETGTKIWHSLPCNDGMETIETGLPGSKGVKWNRQ